MQKAAEVGGYSDEIKSVLTDSAPVLFQMLLSYGGPEMIYEFSRPGNEPLTTKYVSLLFVSVMSKTETLCFLEALWTSPGSITTLRTLLTPRMALKPTTITSITALE